MTREDLLAAGFRAYRPGLKQHAEEMLQKDVREDGEALFFINVYRYDLRSVRPELGAAFTAEVSFYRPRGDEEPLQMVVKIPDADRLTTADLEDYYRDLYTLLGCVPDIHNN